MYLRVYLNGNCVRDLSCPEWQHYCYEIHLVKDEVVKADINTFYYVSIHRCMCSGFCALKSGDALPLLSGLMNIPDMQNDICIWCFYFSWRIVFSSCFLTPAPILAMLFKYIELKWVSGTISMSGLAVSSG